MPHINIEIKARTTRHDAIRRLLEQQGADFKGIDHQKDTYFRVNNGRLKLREGNIENNLIFYHRRDTEGPKQSDVMLFGTGGSTELGLMLGEALSVKTIVDKTREIYFIGNVKFHLDTIAGLGTFVEIEAIGTDETFTAEILQQQCGFYIDLFGIQAADLVSCSYSDMLEQQAGSNT